MLNLKIALDEGGLFPSSEFSAALFFLILRGAGGNPVVRDGGLHCAIPDKTGALRDARRLAALHDPDGTIRLAYARSMWKARPRGTRIVKLGC